MKRCNENQMKSILNLLFFLLIIGNIHSFKINVSYGVDEVKFEIETVFTNVQKSVLKENANESELPKEIELNFTNIAENTSLINNNILVLRRVDSEALFSSNVIEKLKIRFKDDEKSINHQQAIYFDVSSKAYLTLSYENLSKNLIVSGAVYTNSDSMLFLFDNKGKSSSFKTLSCGNEDNLLNKTRNLQANNVWSNCYPGQDEYQALKVGIALTSRTFSVWKTYDESIFQLMTIIEGMNIIYKSQLNIEIILDDVIIDYDSGLSYEEECSDIQNSMITFRTKDKPSLQGSWILLDDCVDFYANMNFIVVGVAYVGTLCKENFNVAVSYIHGSSTWLTVAHELGHTFGASHSFENGVGDTGGIMDYGDGTIDGKYKFNELRKPELCGNIREVNLKATCKDFGLYACADLEPSNIYETSEATESIPCSELLSACFFSYVRDSCPKTCGICDASLRLPYTAPTPFPTTGETAYPTTLPTSFPTNFPSISPTAFPFITPTQYPSSFPTTNPTSFPSNFPTTKPTQYPTTFPSNFPSTKPTNNPTNYPTKFPINN